MLVEGLGCEAAGFRVHMGNRPPLMPFDQPQGVMPLITGDIAAINQAGGNGWRKVFSVYAKLVWALPPHWPQRTREKDWQGYRDGRLLQNGSGTALLFSDPVARPDGIQILMGKGYGEAAAERTGIPLTWLDAHFAVSPDGRTILCPYFDYRQLTNERIERLVGLLNPIHH